MVGLLVVAVAIAMVMVISLLLVRRKPYGTISHGIVEVRPHAAPPQIHPADSQFTPLRFVSLLSNPTLVFPAAGRPHADPRRTTAKQNAKPWLREPHLQVLRTDELSYLGRRQVMPDLPHTHTLPHSHTISYGFGLVVRHKS